MKNLNGIGYMLFSTLISLCLPTFIYKFVLEKEQR